MLSAYRVYRYDHLDSPAVTAGACASLVGAQNGLFPDMGHTVPGEMGGLWAGGKKICDGFFFAIDDVPLLACDACEAHPVATAFHYRMQREQMHVVRRQFIPDGVSGCVIELTVENLRDAPRMAEISFTVRTDIMTVAAALGEDGLELGRDVGEYDEATQAFYARDSRNPWHAVWGADTKSRVLYADLPETVFGFGNTQGKGVNGRLFYRLRVGAHAQAKMRLFVAGGYASRTQAEDALAFLRENADTLIGEKERRTAAMMDASVARLPDERLARCWNWAKIYADWLTRTLPCGGEALSIDLPEHLSLYGERWAQAMGALLPLFGSARVERMLETLVAVSERAQLAPGRLARRVSLDGRVLQAGGVRESAQFVALVHRTLLWGGGAEFAARMLPETGLCMSYLKRATRGFEDVQDDLLPFVRDALAGQAYILTMTGADPTKELEVLARLRAPKEDELAQDAPLDAAARWHGEREHVEQMIGCLSRMAKQGLPGLPGALCGADAGPGVLLASCGAAGLVWPMTENLFGLRPDAGRKVIGFAPHTPIGWDGWSLGAIEIGGARFDVRSERISPSQARYTIKTDAEGWKAAVREGGERRLIPIDGELVLTMGD